MKRINLRPQIAQTTQINFYDVVRKKNLRVNLKPINVKSLTISSYEEQDILEIRCTDGYQRAVGHCNSTGSDQLHGVKKQERDRYLQRYRSLFDERYAKLFGILVFLSFM